MSLAILPKSRNRVSQQGVTGAGFSVSGAGRVAPLDTNKIPPNQTGQTTPKKGVQLSPLARRARAKAWSHNATTALMAVTKSEVQRKRYARTLQCCELMEQKGGKITTYFCQSRACNVCQRMKVQRAIAAYGGHMDGWITEKSAWLITLTIPSVSADMLRPTVKKMHTKYGRVVQELQRLYGKGDFIQGLRATEVTWNPKRAQKNQPAYHGHIHGIFKMTREMGEHFIALWLKAFPEAKRVAQDIRPADGNAQYELLKYVQKSLQPMKGEDGRPLIVPPKIQDEIYGALYRLRCWQAYGISPLNNDEEALTENDEFGDLRVGTEATERPEEHIIWTWMPSLYNWCDLSTGALLCEYEPSEKTLHLLNQFLVNGTADST